MIAFFAAAACLLAVALMFVLWPLLGRARGPATGREVANLDIHRDQLAELAADLEAGTLGADRYAQAKTELEKRVLEEAAPPSPARVATLSQSTPGKTVPILIGILMPLAAGLLYWHLGSPQGLTAPRATAQDASSITPGQFRDMTTALAARMQQNPEDAQGWLMLGRAYRAMERFGEANEAFGHALKLTPRDADLMADFAESLALASGRSLVGEPTRLLDRALKIDANNTKVLTLAGSAAFERKDYRTAIRHWEAIIRQPGANAQLAQALQKGIAESKARMTGKPPAATTAAAGKERVSGIVELAGSLKSAVNAEDTVFVFARAAKGPRMPLAISKITVADLPYRFSFDDSMAMMPEMKLSQFGEVVIAARVSKSGGAAPLAGDLEGFSGSVAPGQSGVRVTIDRAVSAP